MDSHPVGAPRAAGLWTPANIVTLARLAAIPLVAVSILCPWPAWFGLPEGAAAWQGVVGACLYVLVALTDWVDGYLARSRGEVTDFGTFADPLVDKILVAVGMCALMGVGQFPCWAAMVILAREFIVSGARMMAARGGAVVGAARLGKFKAFFQNAAIVFFAVAGTPAVADGACAGAVWALAWTVLVIALVLTLVSMIEYLVLTRTSIGF